MIPDPVVVIMCNAINCGSYGTKSAEIVEDIWAAIDERLIQVGGMVKSDVCGCVYYNDSTIERFCWED